VFSHCSIGRGVEPDSSTAIQSLSPKSTHFESIVSDCIQSHYLNRQAPSIAYLVEQVEAACHAQQLNPPARSTITRRIDAITAYERERRRRGGAAARQAFAARPGYLKADAPLAIVQIDHTRCDVMLVADDQNRGLLGRPWLTVAIDVYSRCVVGFLVSFDAPSATAVALCLESAILPKDEWLREQGMDATWPMFGKPVVLLLDNGSDFHSQALRRGCEEFGISLQYRPVKQPHYGAHVERLIGTLMKRVHLVPGTTFSNTRERGNYDSAKRAVMTLREFRAWLVDQITRWYHAKPHRGLGGRTPSQVWEAGWRSGEKIALPPIVASPIELRAAFMPVTWRKVQRTGLELWGLRYWHEELAPLIGSDERLCIRYDPRDVRYILARGTDGLLLEVPVVSPDVPAISLAEHRVLRRQAREEGRNPELQAIRDEGARRTADGLRKATKATRAARRQRAAVEQRGLDGPNPTLTPAVPAGSEPIGSIDPPPSYIGVAEIWSPSSSEDSL
jgi:putative transposase